MSHFKRAVKNSSVHEDAAGIMKGLRNMENGCGEKEKMSGIILAKI